MRKISRNFEKIAATIWKNGEKVFEKFLSISDESEVN